MLALPADEWQAWSWRCRRDQYGGHRGTQILLAAQIAGRASSDERTFEIYDVAPFLDPDLEAKQRARWESLPTRLKLATREEQDEFLARVEAATAARE